MCDHNLVQIHHNGVLVVTHARRHDPVKQSAATVRSPKGGRRMRPSASVHSVTRKVDSHGNVCFAGENAYAGTKYKRRQVQVAVVGDTVEIAVGEELIRWYKIRHDRTRQHGALANPGGKTQPDQLRLNPPATVR